jgi:WD40 repeat protein
LQTPSPKNLGRGSPFNVSYQNCCKKKIYVNDSQNLIGQLQPDQSQRKYRMCMTIKAVGDKSWVFIGYENGSVALWDIKTCNVIDQINLHTESVMCLDYSRKLNLGISGSADDKLIAWTIDDDCRIVYKNEIITKNPGFNQIFEHTLLCYQINVCSMLKKDTISVFFQH